MATSNTIIPAITSNDLHAQFKLYFTVYQAWAGRSYYGRKSGVTASDDYRMVTVERVTAKAVMFKCKNGHTTWVPISRLKVMEDGSLRVNKGFCYYTGGLNWREPRLRGHYIGGRFGVMI